MPLSFMISKSLLFNFSGSLSFLMEDSVKIFVNFWEVFFIVSATGLNTFLIFWW